MSRKNRDRGSGPANCLEAPAARQEVERLIQKKSFKDALKQAKACFRQEGTPENHCLLERAYLLRAQELLRIGMPSASAEVAGHLLEFGVTDSAVIEQLALLLPSVGMAAKAMLLAGRLDAPDLQAKLTLKSADQAVLHPERAPASHPELRAGALAVRAALQALDDGDESRASEQLRDIPRSSPFSDRRYFVRGLAAFRRHDHESVAANWERLDPDRASFRIATNLRGLREQPAGPNGSSSGAANLSAAERLVFGEPLLARLEQLRKDVAQGHWPEVIRAVGPLSSALKRLDVRLAERLTALLLAPLAHGIHDDSGRQKLQREFARAAQPVPIDPRWNRFLAVCSERDDDCSLEEIVQSWRQYVADLETITSLSEQERPRAGDCPTAHRRSVCDRGPGG